MTEVQLIKKEKNISCPLCRDSNVSLIRSICTKIIIERYNRDFNINVTNLFKDVKNVGLYKCNITGYSFFYPFVVAGDSLFYNELQKFDWYYMPWKWEHKQVYEFIRKLNNPKVLEIGCAKGSFLKKLLQSNINCIGLELNNEAVKFAQDENLKNVKAETIQFHAGANPNVYDVVCSFQVMEHIADIGEAIEASIQSLKVGGSLFISVPNNDSFLGLDDNLLNLPPHHMGLWNKSSLNALTSLYNIKMKRIILEPLQPYHEAYFNRVIQMELVKMSKGMNNIWFFLKGIIGIEFTQRIQMKILQMRKPHLPNFTIIAEYIKL